CPVGMPCFGKVQPTTRSGDRETRDGGCCGGARGDALKGRGRTLFAAFARWQGKNAFRGELEGIVVLGELGLGRTDHGGEEGRIQRLLVLEDREEIVFESDRKQ